MANANFYNLRSSEILRIEAAVMEIMENAEFEPQVDVVLCKADKENVWRMTFNKKTTSLEELFTVKKELGEKFSIQLAAKGKLGIVINVDAPKEEFISLLKRELGKDINRIPTQQTLQLTREN